MLHKFGAVANNMHGNDGGIGFERNLRARSAVRTSFQSCRKDIRHSVVKTVVIAVRLLPRKTCQAEMPAVEHVNVNNSVTFLFFGRDVFYEDHFSASR